MDRIKTAYVNIYDRGITLLSTHSTIEECIEANKSPMAIGVLEIKIDMETLEAETKVVHKYTTESSYNFDKK
jgi:hypothetical protein